MKLHTALITVASALWLIQSAYCLPIPSDGSDGTFNPGSNIEVDLGQATYGQWDANNSANVGKGIYDASKWAVVFKYASINIPAGVTVTFRNNAAHAPVVWLVSGDVTINGTVSVAGKNGTANLIAALVPTEPGPGGFRGGASGPSGRGVGYGPGAVASRDGAQYLTSYGNPQILPLIGGSGGAGSFYNGTVIGSGPGAGGAILIAASGNILLNGLINANGGEYVYHAGGLYYPASAGAVRLIAEQVLGAGELRATYSTAGRIRIETSLLSTNLVINPNTIAIPPPATPVIWPASNAPTASIVSVDNVLAPGEPTAPLLSSADVGIENNQSVWVIIQTTNFPTSGNVRLHITPKYGSAGTVTAQHVSGNFATSLWRAGLTFNPAFTTLQAVATVP